MRSLTLVATVASLIAVSSVAAQADEESLIGKRVRITTSNPTPPADNQRGARPVVVIGELTATSDSTMSLRRSETMDEVTISLSRVQRLEMSTGSDRGASAAKAAVIGLAIGGVVGAAAGEDCSEADFICFERSATAMGGAAAGMTIGFLVGLIAGGGERWEDTAIPRVSIVPMGGRSISIGSTIRFGSNRR
jgi:hypothetical protein